MSVIAGEGPGTDPTRPNSPEDQADLEPVIGPDAGTVRTGKEGPPQDIVLLVNTKSRRGEIWYDAVVKGLKDRGVTIAHAETFKKPALLLQTAKQYVREERPWVVLGGGDGTFSGSAETFAHSKSVLGVLPLGTGNAFARDLGIETDVDSACDVIAAGNVERVDMGFAGDRAFVNVATIGLTAQIAQNLDHKEKRYLGPLAYVLSVFRSLSKVQPFDVELTMDDKTERFRSLQVVIGNGRFHAGPFLLAPDAEIANGKLIAYGLNSTNKADFLRLAIAMVRGKQLELDDVVSLRGTHGRLAATPAQTLILDGEECNKTPFELGVRPGALTVLAPPAAERLEHERA